MERSVLIGLVSSSLLVFVLAAGFVFYLVQFCRRASATKAVSKLWLAIISGGWLLAMTAVTMAWVVSYRLPAWPQSARIGTFVAGFVLTTIVTLVVIIFLPQYAVAFDDEFFYLLGEKIERSLLVEVQQQGRFVVVLYQTYRGRKHKLRWFKNSVTARFIVQHQQQLPVITAADQSRPSGRGGQGSAPAAPQQAFQRAEDIKPPVDSSHETAVKPSDD